MKKILSYILVGATLSFASCSDQSSNEKTDLDGLKEQRDSIRLVINELTLKLKDIEKNINSQDTTKKLYIVSAIESKQELFKHYFEIQGNVNSDQNITIYPETMGLVKKVYVKEGEAVKKGQIIIELDSEILEKSLNELNTNLSLAKTAYKKQKSLWDKKIGSEMEYLRAKSNYESLESKLSGLKAQIEQSKIRAPFSGVIDETFLKEGEMAGPSSPSVRLINLENIYIEAAVSERYLRHIAKGTEALVTFPNLNEQITTEVGTIGNYINPANRSFRIVIDLDNKDKKIKPNQLAVIDILDFEQEGVVIPANLVLNGPDGSSYVYVIQRESNEGVISKRNIEVGRSYKGKIIVLKGLKEGEEIVDKGSRSVQDGQRVRIK